MPSDYAKKKAAKKKEAAKVKGGKKAAVKETKEEPEEEEQVNGAGAAAGADNGAEENGGEKSKEQTYEGKEAARMLGIAVSKVHSVTGFPSMARSNFLTLPDRAKSVGLNSLGRCLSSAARCVEVDTNYVQ